METKTNYKYKTKMALDSLDTIEAVNVSPHFKERTLNILFKEEEQRVSFIERFITPQLQFAAILVIVIVNGFAIYNYSKTTYDSNLTTFSETYSLTVSEDVLIP